MSCGAGNPDGSKFCNQCASPLRSRAAAERRQITVLFSDLVGSIAMSRELDGEDFRDLLNEYQAICHEIVTELGGHVAQYLGDGVMVYFGYPEAHEDDPRRAAQAALGIMDRVKSLSGRLELKLDGAPQVRIGIHTGIVVVGQVGVGREHLALGEAPNLAARLQQLAAPDDIVLTEATRKLIDGFFQTEFCGNETVKGFDEPIAVHRLLSATGARSRVDATKPGLAPLVGRDSEQAELAKLWAAVRDGGGARSVLLTGEAGIGKSRQVQAFKQSISGTYLALEGYCSPLRQNAALRPVAQALESAAAISAHLGDAERFRRLDDHLRELGLDEEAALLLAPALLVPLPEGKQSSVLAPQVKRQRTLEYFVLWLQALARKAPVLFVIEDLHWADPSTLDFIAAFLSAGIGEPIVLLATSRPEFTQAWPRESATSMTLQRLQPELAARVIERVTHGRALPRKLVDRIVDLTDGVPLYLEEVTKAILESGTLRLVGERYELAGELPEGVLPATVHDSLMARLDRQGESKSVAQMAAALGREFSHEVLLKVALMDELALNAALKRLIESDLILPDTRDGARVYRFKHALIQETAYQSLLKSKRQQYHHRIASVLCDQFPEVSRTQPDLIAQHHSKANLPDPAAVYFEKAGRAAFAASAYSEAAHHFQAALHQLAKVPSDRQRDRRELEVLSARGLPLLMTKGYAAADVEEVYNRALELCAEVDPPMSVLYGVWVVQHVRGDRLATERIALKFARIAKTSRHPGERLIALTAVGVRDFWRGAFADAITALKEAVTCFEPEMLATLPRDYGYDNALYGHLMLLWAEHLAGRVGDGQATWNVAWSITEQAGAPYLSVMALSFGAAVSRDLGDVEKALEFSARGVELAKTHQLLFWLALAQMQHGWASCMLGAGEAGVAEIEQGLGLFRAIGAALTLPYYLTYLADACLAAGSIEKGLAAVDEGLALTEKNLDRNSAPELLRLKAELDLRRSGFSESAESLLHEALDIARSDGAGLWELKSAMSLARVLWKKGDGERAARVLTDSIKRIHGGEPPVLRAARELDALISAGTRSPTTSAPAG